MKKWILAEQKDKDIINQLLVNRGIEDKESFLNPDFDRDINDPFLFRDMDKAVKRILLALEKKEKIGIFADYDADGIPGAAILYNIFSKIGIKSEIYIPSREEGYGLNTKGIDYLLEQKCKLLVTVDLGITGKNEVEYASSFSMDVIVTDHHEIQSDLVPKKSFAIIHPNLKGQNYPYRFLSGGGVAWKLSQAICEKLCKDKGSIKNYIKWSLDLAAITTICDMVPLLGENRTIVKFGLMVLNKTKNLGLRKLIEILGIESGKINSYTVGFQIGPRINAPGRMDNATESFCLLAGKDSDEATRIAKKLDSINKDRQNELKRVLDEANKKISEKKLSEKKILLVEGKNWPHGIVGLVAGKLMEIFSRPVIVLNEEENEFKGSARSIDGFHLLEALEYSEEYLSKFGGHAKAAGLSLEKKHLSFLYDKLLELAESKLKFEDLIPKIHIDMELDPKDINIELAMEINKFEPFGLSNPRPIFMLKNVSIDGMRKIGRDEKHLKLIICANNYSFDAVAFDFGKLYDKLKLSKFVDIVFTIDINCWNNQEKLQLKILDIQDDEK